MNSQSILPVNVTNAPSGETIPAYATDLTSGNRVLVLMRPARNETQFHFTAKHGAKLVRTQVNLSNEAAEALFGIMSLMGFKAPEVIATMVDVPVVLPESQNQQDA